MTNITPDNFCEIFTSAFVNDPDLGDEELWVIDYCSCGASNSTVTTSDPKELDCFKRSPGDCTEKEGCARMEIVVDTRVEIRTKLDYCFNLTYYLDVVFPTSASSSEFLMLLGSTQKVMNSYNWCPLMSTGFTVMNNKGRLEKCQTQSISRFLSGRFQ